MQIIYMPNKEKYPNKKNIRIDTKKLPTSSFLPFFFCSEVNLWIYSVGILACVYYIMCAYEQEKVNLEKHQDEQLKAYRRQKELDQMRKELGLEVCENVNTDNLI